MRELSLVRATLHHLPCLDKNTITKSYMKIYKDKGNIASVVPSFIFYTILFYLLKRSQ